MDRPPSRIYHAVPKSLWCDARDAGKVYLPPTYQADGFIHATHDPTLLVGMLNQFYKDVSSEFSCLEIDTGILESKVVMEDPAAAGNQSTKGGPSKFPHIYGPIKPLQCVVGEYSVVRAEDGTFVRVNIPQIQPAVTLPKPAAKSSGRPEAPPKTGLVLLLSKLKVLNVIDYTYNLTRDLLDSDRLRGRKDFVRRLLALCWPFGGQNPDKRCQNEVLALLFLGIIRTVLMDRSFAVISKLVRAVYHKQPGVLQSKLTLCCVITALGSLCNALYSFNEESLEISWREKLVQAAHSKYFQNASYYHVAHLPALKGKPQKIADCNNKITAEAVYISSRLVKIVSALTAALPPAAWFTYKLYLLRGLKIALLPHLYLMMAYEVAQRFFPKDIGKRAKAQSQAVGEYRVAASRVQTHAEAIVSADGTKREAEILQGEPLNHCQCVSELFG